MKITTTVFLIFASLFLQVNELYSQKKLKTPIYKDLKVSIVDDSLEVSLKICVSRRVLKRNYIMRIKPVLSSDSSNLSLPDIDVYTRYSSLMARKRYFYDRLQNTNNATYRLERGDTLYYNYRFAYKTWMSEDLSLTNLTTVKGCCDTIIVAALPIPLSFENLEPVQAVQLQAIQARAIQLEFRHARIASFIPRIASLKKRYSAINDISEYEKGEIIRDGSITIHFEKDSCVVNSKFGNNVESIKTLTEIAAISSNDSAIALGKIVIKGFSSIEGSYAYNLSLSERRAEALREYVSRFTKLDSKVLDISYEGEDWSGLREMVVKSNMKEKQAVLHIIDNVKDFYLRERRLKDMNNGVTYKYMEKYFFPEFRKAGYVRFYYKMAD